MSCSGPRRMDARYEWFGSAGPPPARLTGNADYFHDRARRSVSAPDRTRLGSFRLSHKTFRRRGSGEGRSQGSRSLGSTAQPPEQRAEPVRSWQASKLLQAAAAGETRAPDAALVITSESSESA